MRKNFILILLLLCSFAAYSKNSLQFRLIRDDVNLNVEKLPKNCEALKYGEEELAVEKKAIIDEKHITKIILKDDEMDHEPTVVFELSKNGQKKLASVTGKNIGKCVAIVFEGEVLVRAKITEKIDTEQITLALVNEKTVEKLKESFEVEDNRGNLKKTLGEGILVEDGFKLEDFLKDTSSIDKGEPLQVMLAFLHYYRLGDERYKNFIEDYKSFKKENLIYRFDTDFKNTFAKSKDLKFCLYPETFVQLNDDIFLCDVGCEAEFEKIGKSSNILLLVMAKNAKDEWIVLLLRS